MLGAALLALLAPAGASARAGDVPPAEHHTAVATVPASGPRVERSRPAQAPLLVEDAAALRRQKAAAAEGASGFGPAPGTMALGEDATAAPDSTEATAAPDATAPSGLNKRGLGPNGWSPPDTTGAVGPSHYVELVNSRIGVYDKATLDPIGSPLELRDFIDLAPGDEAVFDPQVMYDPQSGRWYYLMDRLQGARGSQTAFLAFGWSRTSDPSDLANGWCHFQLLTNQEFDDYPKLGDNDTHLAFGTNVFETNAGIDTRRDFFTSRIWSVPKPPPDVNCPTEVAGIKSFGTQTAQLTDSDGSRAFTPVPASTVDSSATGYVVAAQGDGHTGDRIMAWHVTASGDLVADGKVAVNAYAAPPDVPQPPTGCAAACDTLDSLDGRLTQAVSVKDPYAAGAQAVWTQHTIAGAGRSVVRWYELLPAQCNAASCPASAVRQQGEIAHPDHFVFDGAISPTRDGDAAVINYNVGSATLPAEVRARGRVGQTPLGGMGAEVTLDTSAGSLDDHTCGTRDTRPSCRWGDYAGATPDPGNPRRVWGSNQSIGATTPGTPHWQTKNFALDVPATPVASFTASPNPVFKGTQVNFDASSSRDLDGTISRYEWDLDGNGTFETNTGTNPRTSRIYTAAGSAAVGLRVTDNDSFTGQAVRPVEVQNRPPTAVFASSAERVPTGTQVDFDGSGSSDPDGTIARYEWDLDGDGSFETDTGTTPTVSRTYASPGTFQVGLRITDSDSAGAQTSRTIRVDNRGPAASFTVTPNPASAGSGADFDASGSTDPDGTIARYEWDLDGNGSFETDTGVTPTTSRVYPTPGPVTVTLRVTDSNGSSAEAATTLLVRDTRPPRLRLAAIPRSRTRIAAFLRNGLPLIVRAQEPFSCTGRLRLDRSTARTLRLRRVVIASARCSMLTPGTNRLVPKATRSARRALRRRPRGFTAMVAISARDVAGNPASLSKRIRFRR